MTVDKTFCSSPWIHMRILSSGDYMFCRWANRPNNTLSKTNIKDTHPLVFFQQGMSQIRSVMMAGQQPGGCDTCSEMESYNKISGRQRQLLKVGIDTENFVSTTKSSPYIDEFTYSLENQGHTNLKPVDWQIDLGNFCNSACIFCNPGNSSRIAAEHKQLKLITHLPPNSWADNTEIVENFLETLKQTENLVYLHFLGGETIITPAFRTIIQGLIDQGLNKNISIGLTTNLTVWDESINKLLIQFKEVNLGLSIESLHSINDYLRWPSKIDQVKHILDQWIDLGKKHQWLISLRTTPTMLSIKHILGLYQYAWDQNIGIESCNFLQDPACLRVTVLPQELRQHIANDLKKWYDQTIVNVNAEHQVINTRNPNQTRLSILQDLKSLIEYLLSADDESAQVKETVDFLKIRESLHNNSVLNYLPEYEEFLRTAGY